MSEKEINKRKTNTKQYGFLFAILSLEIIAVLSLISIVIFFIFAVFAFFSDNIDYILFASISLTFMSIGLIVDILVFIWLFFTIKFLKLNSKKAKISGIIFGFLILFVYPLGTLVGLIILYGLIRAYQQDKN